MLTTQMQIVALYAGLSGLIVLVLAALVSRARRKYKVALGDGGLPPVLQAQRAHANAVEYIPIVLILMLTLAGLKASAILLHVIGGMLVAGRALHAIGLHQTSNISVGRSIGIVLTWLALAVASVACLLYALG